MKRLILLVLMIISISLAVYLFFNTRSKPSETIVECSIVKIVCPDNFLSSCNSIYDSSTKTCINCIPDCTGHENQAQIESNASSIVLCPEVILSPDFCSDGRIEPVYNAIGCVVSYECIK
jgi:hypothetical protein